MKQAEKDDLILSVPVGDIGKTDYDVVLGRDVVAKERVHLSSFWSNERKWLLYSIKYGFNV